MAPSRDTSWLHAFPGEEEWYLAAGNGLRRALEQLPRPNRQVPGLVLAIGCGDRGHAKAFSKHNKPPGALAHIEIEKSSLHEDSPLLIATVDTAAPLAKRDGQVLEQPCHSVKWMERPECARSRALIDAVLGRIAFPFADVICLFLDDFTSTEEAFRLLTHWSRISSNYSNLWKPGFIVVSNRPVPKSYRGRLEDLRDIQCLQVTRKKSTVMSAIRRQVSLVHKCREEAKVLFSAIHLNAFFELALKHTARSTNSFSFVVATRSYNPIDSQFPTHLNVFLQLCMSNQYSRHFGLRHIASALVMDSCPPGMHRFSAPTVFDTLYLSQCMDAYTNLQDQKQSPTSLCNETKDYFCKMYTPLQETDSTCKQHQTQVQSAGIDWNNLITTQTCLFCLRRKPEYALPCKHAFCEVCVAMFGVRASDKEYVYTVNSCLLCQKRCHLNVHLKPPTAGVRLLALDGGGVRGVFTLQALKALDVHRDLPYPIYDDFDLALGTSSGGLIVLMMFLRRPLVECISLFEKLAQRIFWIRTCKPLFAKTYFFLKSLLTDSLYGANEIEDCVKEAYGAQTVLFNGLGNTSGELRARYAVTSMSVSTSRLCILSTYNGSKKRNGYTHYRPKSHEEEVLVRDAARATSAAPFYFPAKFIRGFGYCQDGGAGKHNNPIDAADWESKAIWGVETDIAISIGTSYAPSPALSPIVSHRMQFRDRYFLRLFRLFSAMLSAQSSWDEHLNRKTEKEREKYVRINMPLDKEPELDDVGKLPAIKSSAAGFLKDYDFTLVLQGLFAAAFFVELDQEPTTKKHRLLCSATIRCRSPRPQALVHRILREYPSASFMIGESSSLGRMETFSLCPSCGYYMKRISFHVYHVDQDFSVYLKFNQISKRHLSGFPQSTSQMSKKQALDAYFGRSDHQLHANSSHTSCRCDELGRKRRQAHSSKRGQKRRRLD